MSPKKIIAGADQDPKSPENKPTEAAEALKQANIGPLDDESLTTLAEMPSEDIWLANARSKSVHTARYYQTDLEQFKKYFKIKSPTNYRNITSKHVVQYRIYLQYGPKFKIGDAIPENTPLRASNGAVARKLSSVSSLFTFFCEQGAMRSNPFKVIKRPKVNNKVGKSKRLSDAEARKLLAQPPADTFVGKRDKAILDTLLHCGLRRQELCNLKVKSIYIDDGVPKFRIYGKGQKERAIPVAISSLRAINDYLKTSGHGNNPENPLFLPLAQYKDKEGNLKHFTGDGIYNIVMDYAAKAGIDLTDFHPHSCRATGATNAIENGATLQDVQFWLGHADISTTRIYLPSKTDDASHLLLK